MNDKVKATAEKLVSYCQNGKAMQGLEEYYAPEAVSVEAYANPETGNRETAGRDGIKGKHEWWNNSMEEHSSSVEGPFMHGENRFGVIFNADVTDRNSGNRMQMRELGIYTCNDDGQIIREEFYYTM